MNEQIQSLMQTYQRSLNEGNGEGTQPRGLCRQADRRRVEDLPVHLQSRGLRW